MKKLLLCFALVGLLLTGCTKNYESVDDYVKEMKEKRAKYEVFFFEANKADVNGNTFSRNMFEGNKFRTDLSDDAGYTYKSSVLYDGKDVYEFVEADKTAVVTSGVDAQTAIEMNPFYPVTNWWEDIESGKVSAKFVKNKYFEDSFNCRLLDFSDGREACIADNYGIATYYKQEPKSQGYKREGVIIDVIHIDVKTTVPPNLFVLPEDVVKKDKTIEKKEEKK